MTRLASYLCFIVLCLAFVSGANAQDTGNSVQYINYLNQQKANLNLSINQLKLHPQKVSEKTLDKRVESLKLLIKINNNRLARLEQSLNSYQQTTKQYERRKKQLISLQVNPVFDKQVNSKQRVDKIEQKTEVNKNVIDLLSENIGLTKKYNELLTSYFQELLKQLEHNKLQANLAQIDKKKKDLKLQIKQLMDKSIEMQRSPVVSNIINEMMLELNLVLNNQHIKLLQLKNDFLQVDKKLLFAAYLQKVALDSQQLQRARNYYDMLQTQLNELMLESNSSIGLLSEQQASISKSSINFSSHFMKNHQKLIQQYKQFSVNLKQQIAKVSQKLLIINDTLQQEIAVRHELFDRTQLSSSYFHDILEVPERFYQHLQLLNKQFFQQIEWRSALEKSVYWFVSLLFIGLFFFLKKQLSLSLAGKNNKRISTKLLRISLYLMHANLGLIMVMMWLALIFKLAQLPFQNYKLVSILFLVVLVFKLTIGVARFTLFDRMSDSSGGDVRLYHRLRWSLVFGALVSCLMFVSQQLLLSLWVQDLFSRLFMLFLLSLGVILLYSREVIPSLLRPLIRARRPYFKRFIRLLTLLVPMALLVNALTGLLGYIDLAWTMGYYQVIFIVLASAYVIARGMLVDLLEVFADLMIAKLSNGWLWSEVFLKPLHKLLRIGLFLGFTYALFLSFGWLSNDIIVGKVQSFFMHDVVNFSGIHITILSTIEFIVLLSVFIWAAKWTREICYRWLFRDVKDPGIRNSLAVFSQYALIISGTIITLRVLGIDFSGMSVVLGGLAVGMGFGLRDFASNIIGGFMLLIERPVREGDLITLGNYEGRVAHIGIRSMRVRSWDNMEVLIPNAETFNKPFTNWTHQDSIVRTVIPIKAQASDDPVEIQQLIFDVLHIIPEVLTEPVPQVFLKQIDEALVQFEVRYFLNIDRNSRVETRSQVLFAITAQFKAAGIKPPIPPIQITHENSAKEH